MGVRLNDATGIVPAAVAGAMTPLTFRGSLVAWATVGLSWAVALPLLARMRGADIRGMLGADARAARRGEPVHERRLG